MNKSIFGPFYYLWFFLLFCIIQTGCKNHPSSAVDDKNNESDSSSIDTLPEYAMPVLTDSILQDFFNQHPELKNNQKELTEFYHKRNFNFAWFNNYGLTEQTGKVVNLIRDYIESGLVDTTIFIPGIRQLYDTVSAESFTPTGNDSLIISTDLLFTSQFFIFSRKAWKGLDEEKLRKLEWFIPVNKPTQVAYLDSILSAPPGDIEGTEPVYKQFLLLKDKLKLYASIQDSGGWEPLAGIDKNLKTGDSSDIVVKVKQRLKLTGDYSGNELNSTIDSVFASQLSVIREQYGLSTDGVIDQKLINELNVPVNKRIRQIMLNLERWKWLPADRGTDFIVVNIPEFKLHVFENNAEVKSMKVIVGKEANQTVIFSGDLKYVVMSPYWVIPRSIIAKETLPAVKRNHSYISSHNMEVVTNGNPPKVVSTSSIDWDKYNGSSFPYTIRQKPGPSNSLGYVKFLFPNSYSIYLHDTPARDLFEREGRTFSHGCIRIAEPEWMANYLLRNDSTWNKDKIYKTMHGGKEKTVQLKQQLPVYIVYFTSWVDKNGHINFRNDIYGHDAKLEKMIFE